MAIAYRKKKMDSRFWCPILLAFAMLSAGARSQSTDALGFLSIDCGLNPGSSYVDPVTNISYVSDAGFINTGVNRNISASYLSDVTPQHLRTLRSFPNGARNCYTIGSPAVARGSKYLLRAWFVYGNYDGNNGQPLAFDLHLDVNYWSGVNVTNATSHHMTETITVATAGYFSVCLVNTGTGTPFISAIDLRPLKDSLYPAANESRSLVLLCRWNLGVASDYYIRYPDDPLDRWWPPNPSISPLLKNVATNSTVRNLPQDSFQVPSVVMQTAVTPFHGSSIVIKWDSLAGDDVNQFFPILHISDILDPSGSNLSRQFTVYVNGLRWVGGIMTPPYLYSAAVYSLAPLPSFPTYNISIKALTSYTLPPILNAFELFRTMSNASVASDAGDGNYSSISSWNEHLTRVLSSSATGDLRPYDFIDKLQAPNQLIQPVRANSVHTLQQKAKPWPPEPPPTGPTVIVRELCYPMAIANRKKKMDSIFWWSFLLAFSMASAGVRSQSTEALGFLSIDCGIEPSSSYVDPLTNISYVSDTGFIDTGVNHNISVAYVGDFKAPRFRTLRAFPNGTRNCYTIRSPVVVRGSKYLLRAWFYYGNYDGLNSQPQSFDLHLGVNYWDRVNVTTAEPFYWTETITVATAGYLSACLVNTGTGTPFISGIDLRPLKDRLYPAANESRSLVLFGRWNMGEEFDYIRNELGGSLSRYPDDPLDRVWLLLSSTQMKWNDASTDSTVENLSEDFFQAPSVVMQTAVNPIDSSSIVITWHPSPGVVNQFFPILHISEIADLSGTDQSRQFNIYANGLRWLPEIVTPPYLYSGFVYSLVPLLSSPTYNISLEALSNSTLPPILNAFELYTTMSNTSVPSDAGDVDAMTTIKERYRIQRNWMGDPCSPNAFVWDGLNCTYILSNSPRVTTLNLSSSGLTGEITKFVASLSALQYLDLSYNNLTGPIPSVLANLSSLKLLDLTSNQLNGSVPSSLLEMSQNGLLTLRLDGNPHLCNNGTSCNVMPAPKKKKISPPVVVILCIVPVLILLALIAIVWRVRKTLGSSIANSVDLQNGFLKQTDNALQLENRQFTYTELENITNNFQKILGEGGFGSVFYGRLEDGTQVAVKMLSQSSSQGTKEFLAEARHLTKVHHRNLVSLVGYCNEVKHLGLVYEFMSQGTLQDHLRGRANNARALSWRQRLHMAIDAAQGLEYLQKGCKPPLVHRDVKSGNILLSETLEAKIADFGLSKAFLSEVNSHISTVVVGTPGYLDPEYYNTSQLSEKSDVYSYGVVLLELITGLPPIVPGTKNVHLVQWVLQRLDRGNIEDVVDPRLEGEYDINSVWKCADIALKCTTQRSQQRPNMTEVVMQLKESLELENIHYTNTVTCRENPY
ncbi:probable LRR receptor-like serine/threonine-protein kinase At1g05700 [Zingiber officinale]|uniref:probable LRR receptor-like serine/threonine-protein kinase At1g05700 n=1 Tax=Zingiber officinale TaxID=94328 RepID=UPI001C4C4355|nr:probable LRR receptor-like serine/threonine-protein kinase At1g05700 [Zingiber officinale]